ncbi:MAG: hypothetical protein IJD65_03425 [Mailhella sp.]|nr:hypothetical protein [Mailhella sp.]
MKFSPLLISFLAAGILYVPAANAEPGFESSSSNISITEAVNSDALAFIRAEKGKLDSGFAISVEKISDADLDRLCSAFPDIEKLTIDDEGKLTTLAPLAKLAKLTEFDGNELHGVKDFSPLAGLTGLTSLAVESEGMTGDLKWMSALAKLESIEIKAENLTSFEGVPSLPSLTEASFHRAAPADLTPLVKSLPALTELDLSYCKIADFTPLAQLADLEYLNLYGAAVKDFSPLAQCPKLDKVTYYAVKGADFSTLGALKQVTELDGGLTQLADLAWIADMPRLRTFDLFSEHVTDYSPLAKTNIEKLTIWSMKKPVGDLAAIGSMPKLRELKLWTVEGASNSAALAGLASLENFVISGDYNKKGGEAFDLAAASGWAKVKKMDIQGTDVANADKAGALPALEQLSIRKVNQRSGKPLSLAAFGKAAALKSVTIDDCAVADFAALAGCASLERVKLSKVKGVTGIDALKKCPNLKNIDISKCPDIPDSALSGFDSKVKIRKR